MGRTQPMPHWPEIGQQRTFGFPCGLAAETHCRDALDSPEARLTSITDSGSVGRILALRAPGEVAGSGTVVSAPVRVKRFPN